MTFSNASHTYATSIQASARSNVYTERGSYVFSAEDKVLTLTNAATGASWWVSIDILSQQPADTTAQSLQPQSESLTEPKPVEILAPDGTIQGYIMEGAGPRGLVPFPLDEESLVFVLAHEWKRD
jgi:hypothetical protein